jgi:hypothetical protein
VGNIIVLRRCVHPTGGNVGFNLCAVVVKILIKHIVEVTVPNATAEQFYDFMIESCDQRYSEWWPGEHLHFHIIKNNRSNHLGDTVFMDEYLGKEHHLTFFALVRIANRPNKILWQMKKLRIRLPAFVEIEWNDSDDGVEVKHELRLGFSGIGKILDPFIRLYFNQSFQQALRDHCEIEWFRLAEYLKSQH